MKTKKAPFILSVLLIFSLTITGCNTAKRPTPENNTSPQNVQNNTNTPQQRVENDAVVNDNRTRDNVMPNRPIPTTPDSTVGFTLSQINEFNLDIELTNNDKIDMKYKKGPSNRESKVETRINGKVEKTEHEEASRQIEELISKIPGASISDTTKIIDEILSALKIKRDDLTEFDMMFKFESGEKVQIELNKK
ncbi:YusW family protein [Alkaliphilus sp. B6464]|uniref:YusW family protein n=1 Tax=Alkaliphilus sp. B6464 TaxID=2731219 RepID=UPI001BA50AD3|nr:YusW family protein [Alkaliphilus sp. B6464]QUH21201.1 hypothetical protein HYG84_15795 [Alkaliphilus sp. B6464]